MLARKQTTAGLLFIAPAVLFFLVFWSAPVLTSAYYSLTSWRVGSAPTFIGLDNYVQLVSDPLFRSAAWASLQIAVLAVIPGLAIALLLALVLSDPRIRGGRVWRGLFMIPVVTDWVATGLVWQLIFLPNQGVLAGIFAQLHLQGLVQVGWTSSASLAPVAISVFIVWKTTSLYTIFLFAALRSIPGDVLEAAQMDGAGSARTFWSIKWPLVRPITVFVVVLSFVTTLGLFEPVFMLTGGGPANATRTLPLFLYENFFTFSRSGYASAAGIAFLVFSLLFAFACSRVLKEEAD